MTDRPLKTTNFLAQKRPCGPEPSFLARLWRKPDEPALVTYFAAPGPQAREDEKRREYRRRTRLRVGKILDRANRFLADATIIDRSCRGLRLRLAREIAAPEIFHFFDEENEAIFVARIIWRERAASWRGAREIRRCGAPADLRPAHKILRHERLSRAARMRGGFSTALRGAILQFTVRQ